jgi:hypothetical protein
MPLNAEICEPVPAEDALRNDQQVLLVRFDRAQERSRASVVRALRASPADWREGWRS